MQTSARLDIAQLKLFASILNKRSGFNYHSSHAVFMSMRGEIAELTRRSHRSNAEQQRIVRRIGDLTSEEQHAATEEEFDRPA